MSNDWINRETACASRWISNYEPWYRAVVCEAENIVNRIRTPSFISEENKALWLVYRLSDWLRYYFSENHVFDFETIRQDEHLYNTLMEIGSLCRVDWNDIATHYIEMAMEEVDA